MPKPIEQSVRFNAPPEQLFEMFMDSTLHTEATGAKATISRKVGGRFTAFDGMLAGRNLAVIPNRLIVQAWRATHWKPEDLDSILIIGFSKAGPGGKVDLVHVNVPQHDHKGVTKGWPKYYWIPWRAYLKRKKQ